jgi:hypothetical protein
LQAEAPGANAYYQYTLLTYQIVWLDETFAIVCFAGHQQRSCQRGDIGLRGHHDQLVVSQSLLVIK